MLCTHKNVGPFPHHFINYENERNGEAQRVSVNKLDFHVSLFLVCVKGIFASMFFSPPKKGEFCGSEAYTVIDGKLVDIIEQKNAESSVSMNWKILL